MPAPDIIHQLVEHFEQNRESYHSGKYNETQLRREFLDPFFEALGWDMNNRQGYAEAYKDVIHEDSLDVEGATKAPDYAFRIGGTRKFFVEAKKPAVNIQTSIDPALQLRRYAWSAHLPLGILSDFEEFAVYESRSKPEKTDSVASGRVMLLDYKDYITRWDELAAIFSREAVLKGSFDKYASGLKGKKGTQEVDDAFLQDIEGWRDLLARNLALRNPGLGVRELNFAVQMTIDRIIFLRICEDRGIEREDQLKELLEGEAVYERLCTLFRQADARYNSGLFHFSKEKAQSSEADDLTLSLAMDDRVLKDILRDLYYPAPYVFREIPADILGQVYERFLGKVIRLTPSHQAKVEEKPEVRKAGGVYYTPTYIVDYVVKNTVGKLLEDKEPKEASKLKIVDPACGSGSFLLGAYQYLLDWHQNWYTEHEPQKWAKGKEPPIYQAQGGGYRLTTAEKKRILLNNIHGVDIDTQAVEVTKLSLSLKVLEGESNKTLQPSLFKERALPDLGRNIQCGNSLIGPDYYEGRQLTMLVDEDERQRVNAFNWHSAFPVVFAQGGFDAVIGNPPYIRIQTMREWAPTEVEFYKKKYKAANKGNYDIYVLFVEKGLGILNKKGQLGFILPHKFFNAQYGEPLRDLISKEKHLTKVVHFGDHQVFENAITYTCLMFLENKGNNEFTFEKVSNIDEWRVTGLSQVGKVSSSSMSNMEWNITLGDRGKIFEKLAKIPFRLSNIADRIFQGLVTGADPVFILNILGKGFYFSESLGKEFEIEDELMHPLCKGSVNIRRYLITELDKAILFPYKLIDRQASLLTEQEISSKYPNGWRYLKENKGKLESRERGKWKHNRWYALGRTQNLNQMEQKKILTPSIAKRASFTLDIDDNYYFIGSGGGGGGGYGITIKGTEATSYEYLLGLLNSKLLDTYLQSFSSPFSGGYFAYNRQYIEVLPIRIINFSLEADILLHNRMIDLVTQMLNLNKQEGKTPQEKERLQREIEATDQQIDALVYQLYGLTEEEIKIVEGKA